MSILSHRGLHTAPHTKADKPRENHGPAVSNGTESSAGQATARGHSPQTPGTFRRRVRRTHRRRSSVWREQVRSRLADLSVELDSLPRSHESDMRREDARQRLTEAETIINRRRRRRPIGNRQRHPIGRIRAV